MSIIHRMGLLGAGVLLCVACSGEVTENEKTHQGRFEELLAPLPANDNPQCTGGEFGDGVSCQDFSTFPKQQMSDACTQAGLVLQDISVTTDGCPDGEWSKATYQCCEAPPPPPLPADCSAGELGDGVTCQDFSAFPSKQQIIDTCAQAGLQLQQISAVTEGCPDGQWNKVTYQCCPAPPPPPPADCSGGELGDGVTCQDLATLKQLGMDACQQAGGTLTDIHKLDVIDDPCSAGQWSLAAYTCCKPSGPPDPCTYTKVGDGATCQDDGALNQQAADFCSAAGLSATATKLAHDCPGGQSSWGEVACCPAP